MFSCFLHKADNTIKHQLEILSELKGSFFFFPVQNVRKHDILCKESSSALSFEISNKC